MRRDCVTQVIRTWRDGEIERFINAAIEDLGEPESAWREDMHGNKKWDYSIVEDEEGRIRLVD